MKVTLRDSTTIYSATTESHCMYFVELLAKADSDYPFLEVNLKDDALLKKYSISKRSYYCFIELFLKLHIITISDFYYSKDNKTARKFKIDLCNFCNFINDIYFQTDQQVNFVLPDLDKLIKNKHVPKSAKIYLREYKVANLSYYSDKWLYNSRQLRYNTAREMNSGIFSIYSSPDDDEAFDEFVDPEYLYEDIENKYKPYGFEGFLSSRKSTLISV